MVETNKALNRIECKVDDLVGKVDKMILLAQDVNSLREKIEGLEKKHEDTIKVLNEKIEKLQDHKWLLPGIGSAVSLVFGYLVLYALHVIK